MDEKISSFATFLINPTFRWVLYFVILCLTILAYVQEPLRYSNVRGITGLPYTWETYILGMFNLCVYFLSFFALWLTIPFIFNFPKYWFVALFAFLFAIYTEIFISSRIYKNNDKDNFQPPPSYIYPKNERLIIHWFILLFDIIIFTQFFLASNEVSIPVKTLLDKYLLGGFGGWVKGNRISFITSWLGLCGILYDIYNIRNQSGFYACKYELPNEWNY
jgi:hypothetical protein